MFRHVFQLMLGPSRYGVDVTVCVTHEVQLVGSASTGLAPIPRKPPTSMTI